MVARGCAMVQRIKGTPGITGLYPPRVHIDGGVWHLDVGSSHPGAGAGPKGRAVRPLKRHASWVQNVVRQWFNLLSLNLAKCWNTRVSDGTRPMLSHPIHKVDSMGSDNPVGAENQQGRLESYLSGFADGEGSFSVGVTRRPDSMFGFQLVPEFRVSQNGERASVLELFQATLSCGSIRRNDRHRLSDKTLVLVVRRRIDLRERVIPFFIRNPLLSEKRESFERFATIVHSMEAGHHLDPLWFERLVRLAFEMNGNGRYRKWALEDVLGLQNPQRLYAGHPEG